jgi:hypothetical protein
MKIAMFARVKNKMLTFVDELICRIVNEYLDLVFLSEEGGDGCCPCLCFKRKERPPTASFPNYPTLVNSLDFSKFVT